MVHRCKENKPCLSGFFCLFTIIYSKDHSLNGSGFFCCANCNVCLMKTMLNFSSKLLI